MIETYGVVDQVVASEYIKSLREHIIYVQEAGRQLGVPQPQLNIHDQSKWSEAEFPGYARHFYGGGDPDGFAYAWLHHVHCNPHHWQYWIFPGGYTSEASRVEDGVAEMPGIYALEMVADWMGASKAYTGSWDMASWLWDHIPKIRVHSRTAKYLVEILDRIGYTDIVYARKFGSEFK